MTCFVEPGTSCIVCPGVPATSGIPSSWDTDLQLGWNAGARSITVLGGDLYAKFTVPYVGGVVCGFAPFPDLVVGSLSDVQRGIYVLTNTGVAFWQAWQDGQQVGPVHQWDPSAGDLEVTLVRANGYATVFVVHDGSTTQYTFSRNFGNELTCLSACLYSAGDYLYDEEFIPLSEATLSLPQIGEAAGDLPLLESYGDVGLFGIGYLPLLESGAEARIEGIGTLPLLESYGDVGEFGVGELPLLVSAGSPASPVPSIAVGFGVLPMLESVSADPHIIYYGEGEPSLPLLESYGDVGEFGIGELPMLQSFGGEALPLTDHGYAEMSFYSAMTAGSYGFFLNSAVQLNVASSIDFVFALYDALGFEARLSSSWQALFALHDGIPLADALVLVHQVAINDQLNFDDQNEAQWVAYAHLADALLIDGLLTNTLSANAVIASAMVFSDLLKLSYHFDINSTFGATDLIESRATLYESMLDQVGFDETLSASLHVSVMVGDTLGLSDNDVAGGLSATGTFNLDLSDQLDFIVRLRLHGEDFVGLVMNTQTAAVSEYHNFNFNSFCNFNGKSYGASDQGIHLLEGSRDEGEPIDALVRTGLLMLGTRQQKRVPKAYVGYTTDGQLVLKVTTLRDGEKHESWYKLTPRIKSVATGNVFHPAKGLRSLYWQFEITNVDGADFVLDDLKVWTIALNRRK